MLEITKTIDIDAPVNDLWRKLAKLDDVQDFVENVTKSYYSSEQKEGVGAERTCEVRGFGTLIEQVIEWKDGETLTYAIEGMPKIVKHAQSTWRLQPKNHVQTTVTVTSSIDTRYGVLGKLMGNLAMKPQLTRVIGGALTSFKQLVEQSEPERGASAQLLQGQLA